MKQRKRIYIQGIVQGVGFRPYVYNLATHYGLTGWVLNNSLGVTIEAQGTEEALHQFLTHLQQNPPPLAQITEVRSETIPVQEETGFRIRQSEKTTEKFTFISPDMSICADCLQELFDPHNRRYRYPFINCTNCGPRFTIIKDIPYDRPNTTMAVFPMCPQCEAEYHDPANRRFHAQPNACPVCGPRIWLEDAKGEPIDGDTITQAIRFLREGRIVAIKGLGGFHLAVDATNEDAVRLLRQRKHRYEKPLALMCESPRHIRQFAEMSALEEEIILSQQRPICLLQKKHPNPIAPSVSPDNDYLGVMLPYTPLHYLLMREGEFLALVMTSGNLSEEPIVYRNEEARERLRGIADFFLMNNRDIYQRADDSVVRVLAGKTAYIRRSRGFVPRPVMVSESLPSVLAVGGELKNVICLNKEQFFFPGQHIGDLENLATLEFFEESIRHFQKILQIEPQLVVCDMHPEYLSTKWAREQERWPVVEVQHHHAHIASAMAENQLKGEVIGLALDGTGYGTDGTIWGGEVLIASEVQFRRAAHFRKVPMPGGEKAIREPWRMATAYLQEASIPFEPESFFPDVTPEEAHLVHQMLQRRFNTPLTSSCGRLFDAVAALAGLRHRVGYEGQAAMQLEARVAVGENDAGDASYPLPVRGNHFPLELDWRPLLKAVWEDISRKRSVEEISSKFHASVIQALVEVSRRIRQEAGLERVVLSGGCFQNRILSEGLIQQLRAEGFRVYYHTVVPPNDGGLSLGQGYIAANQLKQGMIP